MLATTTASVAGNAGGLAAPETPANEQDHGKTLPVPPWRTRLDVVSKSHTDASGFNHQTEICSVNLPRAHRSGTDGNGVSAQELIPGFNELADAIPRELFALMHTNCIDAY